MTINSTYCLWWNEWAKLWTNWYKTISVHGPSRTSATFIPENINSCETGSYRFSRGFYPPRLADRKISLVEFFWGALKPPGVIKKQQEAVAKCCTTTKYCRTVVQFVAWWKLREKKRLGILANFISTVRIIGKSNLIVWLSILKSNFKIKKFL